MTVETQGCQCTPWLRLWPARTKNIERVPVALEENWFLVHLCFYSFRDAAVGQSVRWWCRRTDLHGKSLCDNSVKWNITANCLCVEYQVMSLWTWWVSLTSPLYLLPSYYHLTQSVCTLTYLLSRGTFVLFIYSGYDSVLLSVTNIS